MAELMWQGRPVRFIPLGDGAVTLRVGDTIEPAVNDRMRLFAEAVESAGFPGLVEAVAGYHTVTVFYDAAVLFRGLDRLDVANTADCGSLQEVVCLLLAKLWEQLQEGGGSGARVVELPVAYGGAAGPDLEEAADLCGYRAEEYIRLHSSVLYRVYMIGFVPGFPYLGGLPKELAVPRKDTPRVSIPAGSVAVGGGQTGVYPMSVPGGWRIIGRTDRVLFRPESEEPSLLRAGDRVRFVPVQDGREAGRWR